jgi:quinol monooxygenase YgiN
MPVLLVYLHVKPESVDAFLAATRDNARHSNQEPGIVRFEVLRQEDDPTRFVFVEVYRTEEAHARHRETAHYLAWRDAVGGMLAEPRTHASYTEMFSGE